MQQLNRYSGGDLGWVVEKSDDLRKKITFNCLVVLVLMEQDLQLEGSFLMRQSARCHGSITMLLACLLVLASCRTLTGKAFGWCCAFSVYNNGGAQNVWHVTGRSPSCSA